MTACNWMIPALKDPEAIAARKLILQGWQIIWKSSKGRTACNALLLYRKMKEKVL